MGEQKLKRRWQGVDRAALPRVPRSLCEVAQRIGKLIAAKETGSYKAHRGVEFVAVFSDDYDTSEYIRLRICGKESLIVVTLKVESVEDEFGAELWKGAGCE